MIMFPDVIINESIESLIGTVHQQHTIVSWSTLLS
jgi:hypothetical protein